MTATPLSLGTSTAAPASRWPLAGLSLALLLASLSISSANIALPTLAAAFDAPFAAVQWVVLAYLLASTALVVGIGRLGDLMGRRRLLLGGLALFTLASLFAGAAPDIGWLIAARALQGLGGAAMMALTLALAGAAVPKERLGRALGLLATTSAAGTALGPTLGGLLIAGCGWRAVFLAPLPLALLAFALVRRHLPDDRAAGRPGSFDRRGTLLLALTLGAYALAMTQARSGLGWPTLAPLAASLAGLVLFLRVEARSAAPLLRLSMFRDPVLRGGLVTSLLVMTVMMTTLVVGPFHLGRALGLDTASVGLAVSVGPLVVALGGLPAGRLADRFGAAAMTRAGLLVLGSGCALLALLPPGLGIAGYLGPLVVVTAGYALFQTANSSAVMADVAAEQRGLTSGLLHLSRNLGLVTGTAVMGTLFAATAGDLATALPLEIAAATRLTFAAAALLVLAALAVTLQKRSAR